MENAIDFWNRLDHNWRKIILVNYDFNKRFPGEFEKIAAFISNKGAYNAYYSAFNLRIKDRLDAFDVNEESISQLLEIDCFVLSYQGITDLSPLKHFSGLVHLRVGQSIDHFNQIPKIENVKNLIIACHSLQDVTGIAEWINLEQVTFVYCYKVENLAELNLCKNLKKVDLNYLGRIADISALDNVSEIKIHYDMVHSDHHYYNEVYEKLRKIHHTNLKGFFYKISPEVHKIYSYGTNPVVKKNYFFLIESARYLVQLDGYYEWILLRNNDKPDVINQNTLLNYIRRIFKIW